MYTSKNYSSKMCVNVTLKYFQWFLRLRLSEHLGYYEEQI